MVIAIAVALALLAIPALAATITMNQPTVGPCPQNSNWSRTQCWDSGTAPVAGDDVVLTSPGPANSNADLGA